MATRPQLFHGAVLLAGYASPMNLANQKSQEGREVVVAAAVAGSRVHAVIGDQDTCCPIGVWKRYFNAMQAGGVQVHTLADADHQAVYNRIALGKHYVVQSDM